MTLNRYLIVDLTAKLRAQAVATVTRTHLGEARSNLNQVTALIHRHGWDWEMYADRTGNGSVEIVLGVNQDVREMDWENNHIVRPIVSRHGFGQADAKGSAFP